MALLALALHCTNASAADPKDVTEEWVKKVDGTTLYIGEGQTFKYSRTTELISAEEKDGYVLLLFVAKQTGEEVEVKGLKGSQIAYQPNLFRSSVINITKDEQKQKFIRRGLINLHIKLEDIKPTKRYDKEQSESDSKIGTDEDPVLRPIKGKDSSEPKVGAR